MRLIDPVRLHVQQATTGSAAQPETPLAGVKVGDASYLSQADASAEAIVERDVSEGQHRNTTRRPEWFTSAYLHLPGELRDEAQLAGLVVEDLFGVEGPACTMPDLDAWLEDPMRRAKLLAALRRVETEPSLLGASAHLLLVGSRA